MTQSNRGAAQVGLMWAIALLVVALVSIFLAYSATSRVTETNDQLASANSQITTLKGEMETMRIKDSDVGKAIGWQPANDSIALPQLGAVQDSLAELGAIFPSVATDASVLQSALPGAIADYKASQTRVSDLEQQVAQLRADLEARQTESDNALSEKDSKISDLEGQLQDTTTSLNDNLLDTERQRDALRDQYQQLDEQHSEMVAQKDAEILQVRNASLNLKQRNDILSNRLNGVMRRVDSADGAVLTSNAKISKAWVDLGRVDRLAAGLQFEVLDKTTGAVKGRLQVSKVEEERAECDIVNTADRFNPINSGDKIRNAVFDRNRTPVAVLLGQGFGRYSAADMKAKLAEVGIAVVEEVGVETDYLLLGTPFFDEETGEMLPWNGQDSYKVAQGMSVEIVPRRDWLAWLGL